MKTMTCTKCEGKSRIEYYNHVAAGICFKCNGSGAIKFRKPSKKFAIIATTTGNGDMEARQRGRIFALSATSPENAIKKTISKWQKLNNHNFDWETLEAKEMANA